MIYLFFAILFLSNAYAASPPPIDWSQFNDSVLIQLERPKGNKIGNTICTGVLVHPRVVLTTAHCVDQVIQATVVFDVENGATATKKEIVKKNKFVKHPDYHPKKSLYKNDLAAILLAKAAPLDVKWIRKIPNEKEFALLKLKEGDRLNRVGVGMRNGKNSRTVTDPIFVKIAGKGVFESSDIYSYFGDSGGPVYSVSHDLLAIHSTVDDFDGKGTPHSYGVFLQDYEKWIQKIIAQAKIQN